MGEQTKIEWCDHTFNPWRGCAKVAAGCANCYAETLSKRNPGTLGVWGEQGTRVAASAAMWNEPLKWNTQAKKDGVRRKVFCASLADVFEDWRGSVSKPSGEVMHDLGLDGLRAHLFSLIDSTPYLDWLLLTKRPENIARFWGHAASMTEPMHRPNVWLGTSIANQSDADRNIPLLLKCRDLSPVLFVSAEPLLGPVDLCCVRLPHSGSPYNCLAGRLWHLGEWIDVRDTEPTIDWLIVGGESGPHARPMHPDWARSLRDQCQAAGVPLFFKQWGEWHENGEGFGDDNNRWGTLACSGKWLEYPKTKLAVIRNPDRKDDACMIKCGKKAAGRLLDGREWNDAPQDCGGVK